MLTHPAAKDISYLLRYLQRSWKTQMGSMAILQWLVTILRLLSRRALSVLALKPRLLSWLHRPPDKNPQERLPMCRDILYTSRVLAELVKDVHNPVDENSGEVVCSLYHVFAGRNFCASPTSIEMRPKDMEVSPATPSLLDHDQVPSLTPRQEFRVGLPRPLHNSSNVPSRPPSVSQVPTSEADTQHSTENENEPLNNVHLDSTVAYRLYPCMPEAFNRYDRNIFAPKTMNEIIIEPFTREYDISSPTPPGWTIFAHNEGARYFVYEESRIPIHTEANIFDEKILNKINEDIAVLDDRIRAHNFQLTEEDNLVLDLESRDGMLVTGYYFANHKNRSIFWLHTFAASELPLYRDIRGVNCHSHLGHEIEAQYWFHVQLFPTSFKISELVLDDLESNLICPIIDCKTSRSSNTLFSIGDLEMFRKSVKGFRKHPGTNSVCAAYAIGRLMYNFARQKFINFHGQPAARLQRGQSVHGTKPHKRSRMFSLFSFLLFYAPEAHLCELEKICADGFMTNDGWAQFINKVITEWKEYKINATFLAAINIQFMSIQGIATNTHLQVPSYLATIISVGSVFLADKCVKDFNAKSKKDALQIIYSNRKRAHGLEKLAIMFSLPHTLFKWALIFFLVAFLWMCFAISDTFTSFAVALCSLVVVCLVMWCIWVTRERPSVDEAEENEEDEEEKEVMREPQMSRWARKARALLNGRRPCDSQSERTVADDVA